MKNTSSSKSQPNSPGTSGFQSTAASSGQPATSSGQSSTSVLTRYLVIGEILNIKIIK